MENNESSHPDEAKNEDDIIQTEQTSKITPKSDKMVLYYVTIKIIPIVSRYAGFLVPTYYDKL